MKCGDLDELLSAYADGELPRAQREFVEEHLADCSQCQATLADYMKVRQQLTSLRVVPNMPDIKGSTMSKIKDMHNRPVRRWMRPALAAIPVVIVLIVLLVLQPWGSFPGGILAKAYATTEGLLSYRTSSSRIYTHNGETTIWDSEGEYAAPDRYRGKFTLGNSTFEVITIGDKNYAWRADNTTDNAWGAFILGWPLSTEDTLSLLDLLIKIENLPDERIAGADCFHLRGEIDMERCAEKTKAALDPTDPWYEETVKSIEEQAAATEIVVEIWIGKDDYLIRQVKHNGQVFLGDGEVGTFSFLEVYYDFNEPIEIEPPLDADGKLLPGWQLN
jgi:hypothetical protein